MVPVSEVADKPIAFPSLIPWAISFAHLDDVCVLQFESGKGVGRRRPLETTRRASSENDGFLEARQINVDSLIGSH